MRWLPLLGLLACQANEPLYLPTVEGARTMVLVVLADPPQIQVEDLKAGASGVPLVLDKQQTVVALYFTLPPAALGLTVGPYTSPSSGPYLRAPIAAFRYQAGEAGSLEPAGAEETDDARGRVRVALGDFLACAEVGGCLIAGEGGPECNLNCESPPAPEPPTLPEVPCPSVWEEQADGPAGLKTCRPARVARLICTPGHFQPSRAGTCEPLGPACGEPLPSGGVHVDPTAPAGGDGTLARPFSTIAEAVRRRPSPSVITLAEGDHPGPVTFEAPVEVVGACSGQVRITATGGEAIHVQSEGVLLRNLSVLRTDPGPALRVAGGLSAEAVELGPLELESGLLQLEDVQVRARGAPGLSLLGGRAEVNNLVILAEGSPGLVLEGAQIEGGQVVVEGPNVGWYQGPGVRAHLDGLEIVGALEAGARFTRAEAIGEPCGPLLATTTATLSDVLITEPGPDAQGLSVSCGASTYLNRLAILGHAQVALAIGAAARVEATDWIIEDAAVHQGAFSAIVDGGATFELSRGHIRSSAPDLFAMFDDGTDGQIGDLLLEPLGERESAFRTREARLVLRRILISGVGGFSLSTLGQFIGEDLRIIGSGPLAWSLNGEGSLGRVAIDSTPGSDLGLMVTTCQALSFCPSPVVDIHDLHLSGSKVGLRVPAVAVIAELRNFLFTGHEVGALEFPFPTPFKLRTGTISNSKVVLITGNEGYNFTEMLQGVVLVDNQELRRIVTP
ncbi:MAG: hypothetical protein IPG45_11795 [Deltaproteobacteria bacterium]|nr:hypothetical protein [Deltaproteobacteria bacterium]